MTTSKDLPPIRAQIARLEPFVPIALCAHGFVMLSLRPVQLWQWGLVGFVGVLGLVGLLAWRGSRATRVRAVSLLLLAWPLLFTTGGTGSFFLLWYFVLVSVYPLVLGGWPGLAVPVAASTLYVTLLPFSSDQLPAVVVMARASLLLFIGLMIQQLGALARRYMAQLEQAVAELHARTRHLASLNDLTRAALEAADSPATLQTLADQLDELLDADACYITLWDETQQLPIPVAASGPQREIYPTVRPQPGEVTMTESVLRAGRALVAEDAHHSPFLSPQIAARFSVASMLGVPLIADGQKLGAVFIAFGQPHPFTPDEIARAEQAGAQVALAVARGQLLSEVQAKAAELGRLYAAAQDLSVSLEPQAVLQQVARHLTEAVNATSGYILQMDADGVTVTVLAEHWSEAAAPQERKSDLGRVYPLRDYPITAHAIAEQEIATLQVDDPSLSDLERVQLTEYGVKSALLIPLVTHGRIVGAAEVWDSSRVHAFTPEAIRLARLLATHAAGVIENVRLYAETRQREAQLATLLEVARAVSSRLELEEVLQQVTHSMTRALRLEHCAISDYDPVTRTVRTLAVHVVYGSPHVEEEVGRRYALDDYPTTARVVEGGQGVIVRAADPQADPAEVALLRLYGRAVMLMLPLRIGERPVGLAELYTADARRELSRPDLHLAQALADQAAVAIENARLFEAEHKRVALLTAVHETSLDLSAQLDLPTLLRTIVERAARLLGAPMGSLYLMQRDGQTLEVVVSHNFPRDFTGIRLRLGEGLVGKVVQAGTPLVVPDYSRWPGRAAAFEGAAIGAVMCAPVQWREEIVGVIALADDRPNRFDPADVDILSLFADQAAVAIENARLFEALQHREEYFRALIENSAEGIAILDADGTIRYLGPAQERLVGHKPEDGIGQSAFGRIQLEDLPHVLDAFQQGVQTPDSIVTLEYRMQHADGSWRHFEATGHNLLHDPRVAGVVVNYRDVTERKRAEEALRRRASELEALTQVASALRQAHTREAMLPLVVEVTTQLFRADAGALVLREGETLVLAAARGPAEARMGMWRLPDEGMLWRVVNSGEPFFVNDTAVPSDVMLGEMCEVLLAEMRACAIIPLKTASATVGLMYLATRAPRALTPDELRLLTAIAEMAGNALHRAGVLETLEQRVAERTRELAQANERLKELDLLKDQFVATVSHELRTPLTNITLNLGLLNKRGSVEELRRRLPILQRETQRLSALIEDLLTLSRLEREQATIALEPRVLDGLIVEVLEAHAARIEAKGLTVIHDLNPDAPAVMVDYTGMTQVLTNLVGNAVAYTSAGGCMECRVRFDTEREARGVARRRSRIAVSIYNSGPAIPAEDLPHLFERFYRGRTGRESGESGTGLGLAITKEIVERHGGRIEVDSGEAGTTFTIWLPVG